MARRFVVSGLLLLILMILLVFAAPLAYADPVGCTTQYIDSASNPPPDASPIVCEGPKCRDGIGISPSGTSNLVDHEVGATTTYVDCVV